jgi:hypothetical protein
VTRSPIGTALAKAAPPLELLKKFTQPRLPVNCYYLPEKPEETPLCMSLQIGDYSYSQQNGASVEESKLNFRVQIECFDAEGDST